MWTSTPRELTLILYARADQRMADYNNQRFAAYIGGLVARSQKRPPPLERFLIKKEAKPKRITREQAKSDWDALKSQFPE